MAIEPNNAQHAEAVRAQIEKRRHSFDGEPFFQREPWAFTQGYAKALDWVLALLNDGLVCGFCGGQPEEHGDSDSGPMSVCPPTRFDGPDHEPDNPQGVWCCDTHRDEFDARQVARIDGCKLPHDWVAACPSCGLTRGEIGAQRDGADDVR